jgi:hypothetical protein
MKKTILLTALVLSGLTSFAQTNDEKNIKLFFTTLRTLMHKLLLKKMSLQLN